MDRRAAAARDVRDVDDQPKETTMPEPTLRDAAIAARQLADDTFAAWCLGKATGEAVNNTARVAAFAERRADVAEAAGPYPSIRAGFGASA